MQGAKERPMAKPKPRRRFLVGYPFGTAVWGRTAFEDLVDPSDLECKNYAETMTRVEARVARRSMPDAGSKIYELVECE